MSSGDEEPPVQNDDSSEIDDEESLTDSDAEDQSKIVLNRIEQLTEVPENIQVDSVIVDLCCHPKRNLVASGTIKGPVHLHSYSAGEAGNQHILTYEHHKNPCRAVRFSDAGDYLFTGCQDTMICAVDLETNSVFRKFSREGGAALYSLLPIDSYLLASGEDDGMVVLWDFRMQAPIECFENSEDYISSLTVNREKKILLSTSGDGRLTSYNIRAKKMEMQSEDFDCDLLSAGIFREGSKVVVGAGDGSLNIFNWGQFGNISDRFPGHPGPVNTLSVLSDDVICTGCEDGKVRAVQLFPNRFLGVLGSHHGFSIEKVSLTSDSALLASVSHDQKIMFWDLSGIADLKKEDMKGTNKKHKQMNKEINSFFADLA